MSRRTPATLSPSLLLETVNALIVSREALTLARARWPMQPSPAQMPAYKAGQDALARIESALSKLAVLP